MKDKEMEKQKTRILEVKLSDKKQLNFQVLLEELLKSGHDLFLTEGQSEIVVYLEDRGLVIKKNGTWDIN